MRRSSTGPTNRVWLIVVGVVMVLGGAIGLCLSLAWMDRLERSAGLGLKLPGPQDPVFAGDTARTAFDALTSTALIGLAGLVLAVLGLAWLIFQLPRRNPMPVFGLHDDARTGLITCDAKVIADAVAQRVEQLPGVLASDIALRGTARHPQVTADVEVDDRSAPAEVTHAAVERICSDLAVSLGAEVERVAVRVRVGHASTTSGRAVLTGQVAGGVA